MSTFFRRLVELSALICQHEELRRISPTVIFDCLSLSASLAPVNAAAGLLFLDRKPFEERKAKR